MGAYVLRASLLVLQTASVALFALAAACASALVAFSTADAATSKPMLLAAATSRQARIVEFDGDVNDNQKQGTFLPQQ